MNYRLMRKLGVIALTLTFACVGHLLGQTKDSLNKEVSIAEGSVIGVRDAKLETVWVEGTAENENVLKKEKKTFLSFILPKDQLNSGVVLTAYASNGGVMGQNIWCSRTVAANLRASDKSINNTSNETSVLLEVNSNLSGAAKYDLLVRSNAGNSLPSPESCAECATAGSRVQNCKGM